MSVPALLLPLALAATSTAGGGGLFDDAIETASVAPALLPEEAPSETPRFVPRISWSARLDAQLALDTSFDRRGEQVFELLLGGRFELDVDLTEELSAHTAPSFVSATAISREGSDREMLYLDVPEASVTWARGPFHLRVGALVFNWGSSDLVAPCDVLNPPDLRRTIVGNPGESKLPVLAAEAVGRVGPLTLRGVFEPFFTPGRFFVSGWDSGVAQILTAQGVVLPDLTQAFGAPVADRFADQLLAFDRPSDRPDHFTLGLRGTLDVGDLELSFTFVHGYEHFPRVKLDPNLIIVAGAFLDNITLGRPIPFSDPTFGQAFSDLEHALERGERLFGGEYPRRTLFGLDGTYALDPVVLKLDVAYTLTRTLYTQDFAPIALPWMDVVVGLDYTDGDRFFFTMEGFALLVFDVPGDLRLALFEPREAAPGGTATRTVLLPGMSAGARYSVLDGQLVFELGLATTFTRQDLIISPTIRWKPDDHHSLRLSGVAIEGKKDGYGGIYSHNDQLVLGYSYSL